MVPLARRRSLFGGDLRLAGRYGRLLVVSMPEVARGERLAEREVKKMSNGYGKYLEFQFHRSGDFITALFNAIGKADDGNLDRLAKGFPEEVEAHKTWTRIGTEEVLRKAGEEHWVVKKVRSGEFAI